MSYAVFPASLRKAGSHCSLDSKNLASQSNLKIIFKTPKPCLRWQGVEGAVVCILLPEPEVSVIAS